jgi:hypothetical protein
MAAPERSGRSNPSFAETAGPYRLQSMRKTMTTTSGLAFTL